MFAPTGCLSFLGASEECLIDGPVRPGVGFVLLVVLSPIDSLRGGPIAGPPATAITKVPHGWFVLAVHSAEDVKQ